jgi:hypothetical protein
VAREVSLVSVLGRSLPPAALTFIAAVRDYDWGARDNDGSQNGS